MKKIIRTSEEYRKQKEKELENRKCPECDKEGEHISCNIFEEVYVCDCGCEWVIENEDFIEKFYNQQSMREDDQIIEVVGKTQRESIFRKIRKKIAKIRY